MRYEFGGVPDQFGDPFHIGGDERHARVEGFLGEHGARFPAAGQQSEIGCGEQLADVVTPPYESYRQPFVLDTPLQFGAQRPLAA